MNNIKPNFKIPKKYDRLFILTIGKGFKYIVIVDSKGVHTGQVGTLENQNDGRVLDFIQESIEYARTECGG